MNRSRFLVAAGAQGVRVEDEPLVSPAAGQLRIRAVRSLVSPGTERHYVTKCRETNERLRLGYCSSGWVDAVGEGVTGFAVGDRVAAMGWQYAHHGEVIRVPWRLCVQAPSSLP